MTQRHEVSKCYWKNGTDRLALHSSVQLLSRVPLFATPWTTACQAPCPSPTPRVYPNSSPLNWWCHPTISSSVVPFSSCPQSLPASGSFQTSQLFTSGGQSTGASASTSVLPMNIQDRFYLGWTSWISCPRDSQESSPIPQFKSTNSSALVKYSMEHSESICIISDSLQPHGL